MNAFQQLPQMQVVVQDGKSFVPCLSDVPVERLALIDRGVLLSMAEQLERMNELYGRQSLTTVKERLTISINDCQDIEQLQEFIHTESQYMLTVPRICALNRELQIERSRQRA